MNLNDLAIKHKTDKSNLGHGYTKYYEEYFEPIKDDNLKILELGVREGWSMTMWEEYFQNSIIYGIDNNYEGLCPEKFDSERIIFTLCSQTDQKTLTELSEHVGGFDIIIDDCSHISSLTIKSFLILYPLLKPNGLYVIEDLHVCGFSAEYNPDNFTTIQFLSTLKHDEDKIINFHLNQKICFIRKTL